MAKADKPIDWDGIERDYRAGVMSVREIARWYGITEGAVRKKAKKEGWERKERPPRIEVRKVEAEILGVQPKVEPEGLTDRARSITSRLLDELDTVTSHMGELEDMILEEEGDPRRRQALLKALSLGEQAMTLKNLSTTMKTLNEAAAPQGKKQERQNAAESVAGKFGVRSSPQLVVNNK